MSFEKEINGLSDVVGKQIPGDKLGLFLQKLDDLEYRICLNINNLLNKTFDPRIPLKEQKVSVSLKEHNDLLIKIASLREAGLLQYSALSKQEKSVVWQNYLLDGSKTKGAQKGTEKSITNFQERCETFEGLTELFKKNDAQKLSSILFSDLFRLMKFESGYHLLTKIRSHLESGKTIDLTQHEDYSAQLFPESPRNAFAAQTQESRETVRTFAEYDLDKLKRHYVKDKKSNDPRGSEGLLDKVVVTVPQSRNMEIILGHFDNGKIAYSISPSYRALFHELTHAHRALKGTHKRRFELPKQFGIFFSRNAEELWTIYLGKTSERALSKDDKLPTRLTHSSFTLYEHHGQLVASLDSRRIDRAEMKMLNQKIQTEILRDNKKFNGVMFKGKNKPGDDRLEIDLSGQLGAFTFEKGCATLLAYHAKISKSAFNGADISNSRFVETEASHSNFTKSILHSATIKSSNLNSCKLDDAQVHSATIDRSHFDQASFKKAIILSSSITQSSFAGSTFVQARIENVIFENIDFSDATFKDVIFRNVIFRNCNFSHISATKMKMLDCHFENVSFESATLSNSEISCNPEEYLALNTQNADMLTCSYSNPSSTGSEDSLDRTKKI
ncbi:pentapeptide repeat-containing protein [Legionella cardiaca]|uniref:Pentapeptide repeat-containing protein n=1 Tax=Legionella cardiaca TaxID=1071983 RepID=A0ABY8AR41_9GAMM|nr:pentapeptide repeat-containing protein [Legionella cardiaca]WED43159.1 pentapeptide repeat-containing protein [Legionella cardiaca]